MKTRHVILHARRQSWGMDKMKEILFGMAVKHTHFTSKSDPNSCVSIDRQHSQRFFSEANEVPLILTTIGTFSAHNGNMPVISADADANANTAADSDDLHSSTSNIHCYLSTVSAHLSTVSIFVYISLIRTELTLHVFTADSMHPYTNQL